MILSVGGYSEPYFENTSGFNFFGGVGIWPRHFYAPSLAGDSINYKMRFAPVEYEAIEVLDLVSGQKD
jgi:hypothetical protein